MNKIITLYELLGKSYNLNDDMPEKIKYRDKLYVYAGDDYSVNDEHIEWLFSVPYDVDGTALHDFLNEEVEIIEEDEKIEYLYLDESPQILSSDDDISKHAIHKSMLETQVKIKELIDEVNKLKGDNND